MYFEVTEIPIDYTSTTNEEWKKIISVKLKSASSFEIHCWNEEQAEIESRIVVLEKMLRNAEVIDDDEVNNDMISVGSIVKLYDFEFEEEVEYSIVGSAEADPMNGKISNESPVGLGLIGHKLGETVTIETPSGELKFRIDEIKK